MSSTPPGRLNLGRYETLFPIAVGGMAEVFAARSIGEAGFQKLVALKRMKPDLANDQRFVSMFLDEGRMAANISSPNVVSTLDLGRADDNSLFLVMELVTGVSVANLLQELTLRQDRIPVEIAVEIIAQAANGLHDAHEACAPTGEPLGIIHRDCSPHNILVDVGGQVKITDFGIAKAMERQTESHHGEMKGKLSYLSPEQARGYPVDRRCDVFILGVCAWELMSQRRLFDAQSTVEVLHKIVAMEIPSLDELRKDVPKDVADAIGQALQRDPDDRFATARAFGQALLYAIGDRRPSRAQVGAFVRSYGGQRLVDMERKIRETFGTKSRPAVPSPSLPEYPLPLQAKPELPPSPFASSPPPAPAPMAAPLPPLADLDPLLNGATIQDLPPFGSIEPPDTIPTQALQGVQIDLGPAPAPVPKVPETAVYPRDRSIPAIPTKRRSFAVLAVLSATVIAIAGGVGAAWLLRSDAPDAVHDNAADASAATRQPIAPAPTPPPAVVRPTPEPAAPAAAAHAGGSRRGARRVASRDAAAAPGAPASTRPGGEPAHPPRGPGPVRRSTGRLRRDSLVAFPSCAEWPRSSRSRCWERATCSVETTTRRRRRSRIPRSSRRRPRARRRSPRRTTGPRTTGTAP
ncbi:MAG: serine/threonine protein kinase [Sandaracinaceae bacterium]|nr:serine/threonine protein kinase [Sandaracinaceae bacterium]